MKHILILNGPPRSGKDAAATYLETTHNYFHLKFAQTLKDFTHRLYKLNVNSEYFNDTKDQVLEEFYGITPRQAYIQMSEAYIKPLYGTGFFSKKLVEKIEYTERVTRNFNNMYVISDGGFPEEISFLRELLPSACIYVVRVHREGCNFDNDSRNYLTDDFLKSQEMNLRVLENNSTELKDWHKSIDELHTSVLRESRISTNIAAILAQG